MNNPEDEDRGDLSSDEERDLKNFVRAPGVGAKTPDCPAEERIELAAAGLAPEEETSALLAHAATCDWCGRIVRDLVEPADEEEAALAQASRLADPGTRRELALKLAAASRPIAQVQQARTKWWIWIPVPLAAACGVAGMLFWPTFTVAQTERQLARAYAQYRPMEMRLPGAGYGGVQRERAADGNLPIESSPDLHEAESRILRETEAHPNDAAWLHLQGREYLLTGKAADAIQELERAHGLRPQDAYILADLGAAWFLRAQSAGETRLQFDTKAYDYLAQAARAKPMDPALAFNRALAAEQIFAYTEALKAWDTFLSLDATSPWADEARKHREELKKTRPAASLPRIHQARCVDRRIASRRLGSSESAGRRVSGRGNVPPAAGVFQPSAG